MKLGLMENEYHNILIDEEFEGEFEVIHAKNYGDLRKLIYPTFDRNKNIKLYITDKKLLNDVVGNIHRMWNVYALVESYSGVSIDKESVLPVLRDYEDKKEFFVERLSHFNFTYGVGVKDAIVRNLIRNPAKFKDIKRFRDSVEGGYKVTAIDVDDLFEDSMFFNLEEVCLNIILGLKKRRTSDAINYFCNVKGYEPRWLINKIKETALDLDYMYYLYDNGVVVVPIKSSEYSERIKTIGGVPIDEWYSIGYQHRLLNYVKMFPYTKVKELITKACNVDSSKGLVGIYGLKLNTHNESKRMGLDEIFKRQVLKNKWK